MPKNAFDDKIDDNKYNKLYLYYNYINYIYYIYINYIIQNIYY